MRLQQKIRDHYNSMLGACVSKRESIGAEQGKGDTHTNFYHDCTSFK